MATDDTAAIEARIGEIFRRTLNRQIVSAQTDLLESGLLDSLALVELLAEIEREFELELDLDDLEIESFRTLETIGHFVLDSRPSRPA